MASFTKSPLFFLLGLLLVTILLTGTDAGKTAAEPNVAPGASKKVGEPAMPKMDGTAERAAAVEEEGAEVDGEEDLEGDDLETAGREDAADGDDYIDDAEHQETDPEEDAADHEGQDLLEDAVHEDDLADQENLEDDQLEAAERAEDVAGKEDVKKSVKQETVAADSEKKDVKSETAKVAPSKN